VIPHNRLTVSFDGVWSNGNERGGGGQAMASMRLNQTPQKTTVFFFWDFVSSKFSMLNSCAALSLSAPSDQDYAQAGPPEFIFALDAVKF
jgi:hypothetical protein